MGAHSTQWERYSRSQLEAIIHEAALGDIDEYIARRYLIGHIPHIEIAGELESVMGIKMDRCTVSRRWDRIRKKIEDCTKTAQNKSPFA